MSKNHVLITLIKCTVIAFITLSLYCGIAMQMRPLDAPTSSISTDAQDDSREFWDLIKETVPSPNATQPSVKYNHEWFRGQLPAKGFTYVYGGKTAFRVQQGTSKTSPAILACYMDNREYSGVTIALGNKHSVDFSALRSSKAAGLAFWAKGGIGTESILVGILDDESDGKKVQTRVSIRDFGKIDTMWRYFMIPLKKFQSTGKYWDDDNKMEITDKVDWKKINELRFSINKGENHPAPRSPVALYIDGLGVIDEIPGYVDPDIYWASFSSNEPDLLLENFETASGNFWSTATGPASQVQCNVVPANHPGCGQKALAITYRLNDWCDVMYDLRAHDPTGNKRDWTRYWGIKLMVYTEKPFQSFNIQISDAGNELFIASSGAQSGWNEVIVPFKEFSKFPYYQPPDAVQNGKFDLDSVIMIDIKPAGEGASGTFMVDNIALTNDRSVATAPVLSEKEITVKADWGTLITQRINDGVFGINTQHWDGALLLPKTAELVKSVGHSVIRFPGGLSADEYHWEKSLAEKGHDVTIDQFLDFCKKTGCQAMLTVNFGTGTPEEAAKWVYYVNVEKKAGVRYWEIGNELYGSWHKNHCGAEEYGKRAAQFIMAMKKIDPTILITVVWEIESPWNKTVFDFTRDIADGVNVHNYPQQSGQENDQALLAAPRTLEGIAERVRNQLRNYGDPGKQYQLWLTEWNSVASDPGPQTLGMTNALFVADYLGVLSKINIEQASYWNIHNYTFVQGGDYGYLSRGDGQEGPNVPRPSYWAFKMARESLRGTLAQCQTDDNNMSVYASVHPDGAKSLLIVNKYPKTSAAMTLDIPGFNGDATMLRLDSNSGVRGYSTEHVKLDAHARMNIPAYSITVVTIK